MKYPTLKEIEKADRLQICRWYRFLDLAETPEQLEVIEQLHKRFTEMGGFTPEISKTIGWTEEE